jgi:Bacterial low temperature requirement A protein (LtrA)/Aldo/keto reductase family
MEYIHLGRSGLSVSRLCLGTMNFGPLTPAVDAHAIMDHAHEIGINFFDTANRYGGVQSPPGQLAQHDQSHPGWTEEIIGEWFAGGGERRERTVLATKLYGAMGDWPNEGKLSALNIRRACDASLRRLRTDYIDLYQMHLRDRSGVQRVTNIELFFDLVYVFAVTQLSHYLLGHADLRGALQAGLLLMMVWLVWSYTTWVTNWLDPDLMAVRLLLVVLMLLSLAMSVSLPRAFEDLGLWVGGAYAVQQVGRTLFMVIALRGHPLEANFQRILAWCVVSSAFAVAGGVAHGVTSLLCRTLLCPLGHAGIANGCNPAEPTSE